MQINLLFRNRPWLMVLALYVALAASAPAQNTKSAPAPNNSLPSTQDIFADIPRKKGKSVGSDLVRDSISKRERSHRKSLVENDTQRRNQNAANKGFFWDFLGNLAVTGTQVLAATELARNPGSEYAPIAKMILPSAAGHYPALPSYGSASAPPFQADPSYGGAPAQSGANGGETYNAGITASHSATCSPDGNLDSFVDGLEARYPLRSEWGQRDILLWTAFILDLSLGYLASCQTGLSPREVEIMKAEYLQARDAAIRGCEQLSSTSGSCTPTHYPKPY